jgi:hypothetical protein
MGTHEIVEQTEVSTIYLDDDERQLLYHYAYRELYVPEIVEEIVFLSDDERGCILNCIRLLKKAFFDNDRSRIERRAERGEC